LTKKKISLKHKEKGRILAKEGKKLGSVGPFQNTSIDSLKKTVGTINRERFGKKKSCQKEGKRESTYHRGLSQNEKCSNATVPITRGKNEAKV